MKSNLMPAIASSMVVEDRDDTDGKIFVYAGYLKPGRHQVIVYDPETEQWWGKNIAVDLR
jgi:hypothetical protein